MKKLFKTLIGFIFTGALLVSCGVSKTTIDTQKKVNGDWTLQSITHNGKGNIEINALGEGDKSCLEGSRWLLIRNYTGSFTVNSQRGCNGGNQAISWSIQEIDGEQYFIFKKIVTEKAKDSKFSYKLHLNSVTEANMTLSHQVPFEGKVLTINYTFTK